jgi:hypothetical protein
MLIVALLFVLISPKGTQLGVGALTLTKENLSEVVGIIFPLLPSHLPRFFSGGKTVFVKFFGKERVPQRLRPGHRLFFYESKGNREIVGESRIAEIFSEEAEEVLARFGDRIFLTRSEFEDYVADRKGKRLLVLVLGYPKKYGVPMRLYKSLTMAGQYMTKEMLRKLKADE